MAKQEIALKPIGQPRKIDLAEEMELAGVVVPQDVADAIPAEQPVFLPYQQRWFEDESQIMIGEKSRRTGLTWAEAGRNVVKAAKPRRRQGCNTFYVGSKKEMALEPHQHPGQGPAAHQQRAVPAGRDARHLPGRHRAGGSP